MKQHTNHTDQLKTGSAPLKQIGNQYKLELLADTALRMCHPCPLFLNDQNLNNGTLSERNVCYSRSFGAEAPYHK